MLRSSRNFSTPRRVTPGVTRVVAVLYESRRQPRQHATTHDVHTCPQLSTRLFDCICTDFFSSLLHINSVFCVNMSREVCFNNYPRYGAASPLLLGNFCFCLMALRNMHVTLCTGSAFISEHAALMILKTKVFQSTADENAQEPRRVLKSRIIIRENSSWKIVWL